MTVYFKDPEPVETIDTSTLAYQLGVQDREWLVMPSGVTLTYEVHAEQLLTVHVAEKRRVTIVEHEEAPVTFGRAINVSFA